MISPTLSNSADYTSLVFIDGSLEFDPSPGAHGISHRSRQLETDGYDAIWTSEVGHDPLLTLSLAAGATQRVTLGTSIVVAFGRSPLITATMANDVQLLSQGRLLLGLGSQIKPHIEKRYSMTWSHPAPRMREYILALHAIWSSWNDGAKLFFRGEFYRHTLMTPFFNPGPNPYGPPKVFLAAVGERMTEVAGEVADGLLVHPFTTERYLREVTIPALERGFSRATRERGSFEISYTGLVATGHTNSERNLARDVVRRQLAFYASTPAYRPVLELHGWGYLESELNALSRAGEWEKMAERIDDNVLDAFSIDAPVTEVAPTVRQRFEGLIDRFSFYSNEHVEHSYWREILHDLRASSPSQ
jgi:probable F420-dependent oxidoreductase